eukprot:15803812-Heterocapsa_arctica.AAC.1
MGSLAPGTGEHRQQDVESKEPVPIVALDGYQIFENTSRFPAAVILPSRWFPYIRWSDSNEFAAAVIIGLDTPIMLISAYLPQPGLGLEIYLRAVEAALPFAQSPTTFAET